ncbi:MAG: Polyribonucleotide nucleotidyltransferase [Candidatus Peregrinibacteria bacterium GW2011_GWA2_33_10]|nr:MAG: Polyribonucleotide nucleotidyltransferase [Candidatus Peregrinibacteria bacterium GW2011_GWA2_33_10]
MDNKHKVELNIEGRTLKLEQGLFAEQSTGAVLASFGDTVVLATCVMSDQKRDGIDFFPLSVDYEEKFYATGKIKGSRFIKREGQPSENAILTSRLIDRPLRPLFPKDMRNDVQIISMALSADMEVEPGITAINAASAALVVSGIPFDGPVGAVRIGYINDDNNEKKLIVNPTYEQIEKGFLDLVVVGTKDAITMVEAGAKEVPEDVLLQALEIAHTHIKKLCALQEELRAKIAPKTISYESVDINKDVYDAVNNSVNDEAFDNVKGKTKAEIKVKLHEIEDQVISKLQSEIDAEKFSEKKIKEVLSEKFEKRMRYNILEKEIRVDGRKLDEIRPVSCMTGVLPRTHGSAIFQRGQTQALTITTLGSPGAAQIIDTMDEDSVKRYMHHYNFPPFSTGEAKPLRGASRREIGHGALAERALVPVIPDKDVFPYTIRLVSEILSCNGSSSMASVCGSTLSLMDAGVPIKKPVSGIAMGLVTGENGAFKILSDIQGVEDFAGDMDFKVTGTSDGITALQMDIKVKGLSLDIMRKALNQAKQGRDFILQKMLECLPDTKSELSKYAPLIMSIQIDPDQIRDVIGKGGETIQKIIADTGVEIDIEDSGLVVITSPNQESGLKAADIVRSITYIPKAGEKFKAKIVKLMEFGAFAEFAPGKEGLIHISQLSKNRVVNFFIVLYLFFT